ncbi:MAG: hypothetical protein HQM02_02290 [Magnetococcales bacterium]|nr:hypothetical protein [Magnetococcales bacterium]
MTLLRILLLLAAGYMVFRFVRHLLTPPPASRTGGSTGTAPPSGHPSHLVRCDRCDTLIPPEAAIHADDHHFCSEKCRDMR